MNDMLGGSTASFDKLLAEADSQEVKFSYYSKNNSKNPEKGISLHDLLELVRNDEVIRQKSAAIRELVASGGDGVSLRKLKAKLPCFTASLLSEGRGSGVEALGSHTGLLQVDIDLKDNDKPYDELRAIAESNTSTVMVFKSPSGGVKALLKIEAPSYELTRTNGSNVNKAIDKAVSDWFSSHGVVSDNMKDVKKLCYISHDPTPYFKPYEKAESFIIKEVKGACYIDDIEHIEYTDNVEIQNIETIQPNRGGERCVVPFPQRFKQEQKAIKSLANNVEIAGLYRDYVQTKYNAVSGKRNEQLIKMTTFLYHAIKTEYVIEFGMIYYDTNQTIFNDPRESHEYELMSHLESLAESWNEGLSKEEREIIEGFDPDHNFVTAFRICRDLPKNQKDTTAIVKGQFFLSCDHLGKRLGIAATPAQRLLRQLESAGAIAILLKGEKYAKGGNRQATSFKWLL